MFTEMTEQDLYLIEGGTDILKIIGGGLVVIGGVALLLTPEPTTATKIGGWVTIVGGLGMISDGL